MTVASTTLVVQWTIIGIGACSSVICGISVLYIVCSARHHTPLSLSRNVLGVSSLLLCGIQVLPPLVALRGYSPQVMCGIYTCLTCGFLYPCVHCIVLGMLMHARGRYDTRLASLSSQGSPDRSKKTGKNSQEDLACHAKEELPRGSQRHSAPCWHYGNHRGHVVRTALVCTLPLMIMQSVAAWIGMGFENASRVVQYFISTTAAVPCHDDASTSTSCTVCVFPGISVIIQGLFVLVYCIVLHHTSKHLRNIVINVTLKKKLKIYTRCSWVCSMIGLACMGTTVGVSHQATDLLVWIFVGMWTGTVVFFFALHSMIACFVWIVHSVYETRLAVRSLSADAPEQSDTSTSRYGGDDEDSSLYSISPFGNHGMTSTPNSIMRMTERSQSDCAEVGTGHPHVHVVQRARDVLLSPDELARSVELGNQSRRRWTSYGDGYLPSRDEEEQQEQGEATRRGNTLPATLQQNLFHGTFQHM